MAEEFEVQEGDWVIFQGKRCQVIQSNKDSAVLTLEELPNGELDEQVKTEGVQLMPYPNHENN